jgi:hypothetical protein
VLRKIPAVNVLLDRTDVAALASTYSRDFVTDLVREAVEDLRRAVSSGEADGASVESFSETLRARLEAILARRGRRPCSTPPA